MFENLKKHYENLETILVSCPEIEAYRLTSLDEILRQTSSHDNFVFVIEHLLTSYGAVPGKTENPLKANHKSEQSIS